MTPARIRGAVVPHSAMYLPTTTRSALIMATLVAAFSMLALATAVPFQPITSASTAILGKRLYIYGGLTNLTSPDSYTSQFVTVSLTDGFETDDIPWESLPGSVATAMAPGSSSRDQRRFVIGGTRNNEGNSPAVIFDSNTRTWVQAPDLPGLDPSLKASYHRDSPGMSLDLSSGLLVQYGGLDANHNLTNELSALDTNKATSAIVWSYSGTLASIPALYAPIMVYLSALKATLIMGGCDQVDAQGNLERCASFDRFYLLTSESLLSASVAGSTTPPVVNRITSTNGETLPLPRSMPCAVVLADGNVLMMGGGTPTITGTEVLSDAWILNVQSWTWSKRDIAGLPVEGVMGHSCQLASHEQILVVGGQDGEKFVSRAISVVKTGDWEWVNKYSVPGFSTGVRVGLALSVVVVVGAIIAGLWVRRRRIKKAEEETSIKMRHAQSRRRKSNFSTGGSRMPGIERERSSISGSAPRRSKRERHDHHHHHHAHHHHDLHDNALDAAGVSSGTAGQDVILDLSQYSMPTAYGSSDHTSNQSRDEAEVVQPRDGEGAAHVEGEGSPRESEASTLVVDSLSLAIEPNLTSVESSHHPGRENGEDVQPGSTAAQS